tara:strand:+ start:249 stop:626 length:378 start_codon:yes stop_codon:yes gene_type:complete
MLQFLTPLLNLGSTLVESQIEKQKNKSEIAKAEAKAKSDILKTAATHDSKWELIMAESTKSSIRDEIATIVVLLPVCLVFIPGMEEIVKNGFDRLNELPEWYQYLVIAVILSALGLKGVDKFRRK